MARQDFIDAKGIIDALNESFNKHRQVIEQNAQSVKELHAEYSKLPSDYIKANKEISNALLAQGRAEQQLIKIKSENEKLTQQKIRTEQAEIRLSKQKNAEHENTIKALEREAQKLQAANSLYNKIQQKLNSLTKEYRDLAAAKQLGIKLTDQEQKRYDFLSGRITKYDAALKSVDASMGKYGRNVGNYASGFNPLSNSINQLTREMPAFANSVQTGLMAISNNLPIFFDAISQTRNEIKALRADGQQVPNLFKQLTSSLLSWGTALSVGVTLLTFFGDDIIEWVSGLVDSEKALTASEKATERYNGVLKNLSETSSRLASEEINRSQELLRIAKNTQLSYNQRSEAVKELQSRYPDYLGSLSREKILAGETAEAERALTNALIGRATAMAASELLQENISKELNAQKQLTLELSAYEKQRKELAKQQVYNADLEKQAELNRDIYESLVQVNASEELARMRANEKIKAIREERNVLVDLFNDNAKYLDIVKQESKSKQESKKTTEELIKVQANSRDAFQANISALENHLNATSKIDNSTGKLNYEYNILELQLKLLKDAYEALYGEQEKHNEETEKTIKFGTEEYYTDVINKLKTEQKEMADTTEEYRLYNNIIASTEEALRKLKGETEELNKENKDNSFLQGFINDFSSSTGFDTLFKTLQKDIEGFGEDFETTFLAITEIAQEAFAFMNQNSQAYFDAQYSRLETEKELALKYNAESETGRAEIERQFEEKRRRIRIQEAKASKETAIFNAAINTAQGVTAALAEGPQGIVLAAIIAALGAAQIALIASRPIPAYEHGTDNHSGGLMMVNDAKGSMYQEMVKEPGKSPYIPKGRNVIIDAKKGTKVLDAQSTFDELNDHLINTGISPLANVLTRGTEQKISISGNAGITESQMRRALKDTLGTVQRVNVNIDKNGVRTLIGSETAKQIYLNNKIHSKGYNV